VYTKQWLFSCCSQAGTFVETGTVGAVALNVAFACWPFIACSVTW
jgi:hypothetical protein